MKIKNVRVYGLVESIIACRYPMMVETPDEEEFADLAKTLSTVINLGIKEFDKIPDIVRPYLKRAFALAQADKGSGHDCFMKGIIVQYDLTAPEYFWRQFDRYHFHDIVSSQSKMHRLIRFDLDKMCNSYADEDTKRTLKEEISLYNKMLESDKTPKREKQKQFQRIISNCPMGFELTARITDNYLQLKSKYHQRWDHKLDEWHYYCDWIETLPLAKELIVGRG